MLSAARTHAACLASAEQLINEPRMRVAELAFEQVRAVDPHPLGFVLCFGSGAKLFVPSGVALDRAGLPVIEP